ADYWKRPERCGLVEAFETDRQSTDHRCDRIGSNAVLVMDQEAAIFGDHECDGAAVNGFCPVQLGCADEPDGQFRMGKTRCAVDQVRSVGKLLFCLCHSVARGIQEIACCCFGFCLDMERERSCEIARMCCGE